MRSARLDYCPTPCPEYSDHETSRLRFENLDQVNAAIAAFREEMGIVYEIMQLPYRDQNGVVHEPNPQFDGWEEELGWLLSERARLTALIKAGNHSPGSCTQADQPS